MSVLTRILIANSELVAANDGRPLLLDQSFPQRAVATVGPPVVPVRVAVSPAFNDGDTLRRVTVTDSRVTATSVILLSVERAGSDSDLDDRGYLYIANVVRIRNGTFDVLIAARGWGNDDPIGFAPSESVWLIYAIG